MLEAPPLGGFAPPARRPAPALVTMGTGAGAAPTHVVRVAEAGRRTWRGSAAAQPGTAIRSVQIADAAACLAGHGRVGAATSAVNTGPTPIHPPAARRDGRDPTRPARRLRRQAHARRRSHVNAGPPPAARRGSSVATRQPRTGAWRADRSWPLPAPVRSARIRPVARGRTHPGRWPGGASQGTAQIGAQPRLWAPGAEYEPSSTIAPSAQFDIHRRRRRPQIRSARIEAPHTPARWSQRHPDAGGNREHRRRTGSARSRPQERGATGRPARRRPGGAYIAQRRPARDLALGRAAADGNVASRAIHRHDRLRHLAGAPPAEHQPVEGRRCDRVCRCVAPSILAQCQRGGESIRS